ncbi:MAG: 4Fe-4S dicluster domain-containing protein [Rhodospirillales bacterium]|nr:4Fe-4S dicluster domain-containing protein [Rhodospirillales bacterium]
MAEATTIPDSGRKYDLGFARWVYENVNGGDKLSMCMQCGACSGSCPIGTEMDHGPRKLFMMIRAGMKDEVLSSNTMYNCTSCYRCVVRCPRGVPVTYILQDLGRVAARAGYPQATATDNARFAKAFYWSTRAFGRTDERLFTFKYYLSFGIGKAIKMAMANMPIALSLLKTKRMHIGAPHKIKGTAELRKILDKAEEIEKAKQGF